MIKRYSSNRQQQNRINQPQQNKHQKYISQVSQLKLKKQKLYQNNIQSKHQVPHKKSIYPLTNKIKTQKTNLTLKPHIKNSQSNPKRKQQSLSPNKHSIKLLQKQNMNLKQKIINYQQYIEKLFQVCNQIINQKQNYKRNIREDQASEGKQSQIYKLYPQISMARQYNQIPNTKPYHENTAKSYHDISTTKQHKQTNHMIYAQDRLKNFQQSLQSRYQQYMSLNSAKNHKKTVNQMDSFQKNLQLVNDQLRQQIQNLLNSNNKQSLMLRQLHNQYEILHKQLQKSHYEASILQKQCLKRVKQMQQQINQLQQYKRRNSSSSFTNRQDYTRQSLQLQNPFTFSQPTVSHTASQLTSSENIQHLEKIRQYKLIQQKYQQLLLECRNLNNQLQNNKKQLSQLSNIKQQLRQFKNIENQLSQLKNKQLKSVVKLNDDIKNQHINCQKTRLLQQKLAIQQTQNFKLKMSNTLLNRSCSQLQQKIAYYQHKLQQKQYESSNPIPELKDSLINQNNVNSGRVFHSKIESLQEQITEENQPDDQHNQYTYGQYDNQDSRNLVSQNKFNKPNNLINQINFNNQSNSNQNNFNNTNDTYNQRISQKSKNKNDFTHIRQTSIVIKMQSGEDQQKFMNQLVRPVKQQVQVTHQQSEDNQKKSPIIVLQQYQTYQWSKPSNRPSQGGILPLSQPNVMISLMQLQSHPNSSSNIITSSPQSHSQQSSPKRVAFNTINNKYYQHEQNQTEVKFQYSPTTTERNKTKGKMLFKDDDNNSKFSFNVASQNTVTDEDAKFRTPKFQDHYSTSIHIFDHRQLQDPNKKFQYDKHYSKKQCSNKQTLTEIKTSQDYDKNNYNFTKTNGNFFNDQRCNSKYQSQIKQRQQSILDMKPIIIDDQAFN